MNKKKIININNLEISRCASEDVKDIYELQNKAFFQLLMENVLILMGYSFT